MMREFSSVTQLGPELNGIIIRTYRQLTPEGEFIYSSEVDLKPGDKIIIDDPSAVRSVRRLQELIPFSLSCRQMMEG